MSTEIRTAIDTSHGIRIIVSERVTGGAWMMLSVESASISALTTPAELDQLIKGLQAIQEAAK